MSDDRLRLLVERIERISEEIAALQQDRRDVISEAKAYGYDAATLRKVIQRRKMNPSDRCEADALLESYEAALGMDDGAFDAKPIMPPEAMEVATALLAEQVVAMGDPAEAALLVGHVMFLLDLREEIRVLRGEESDRKKLAKAEGFDAKQLALVVRWFEKVAKHGEEAMRLGEETFRLYRSTVEAKGASVETATADPLLQALFKPPAPDKLTKRAKASASLRAASQMAARALRGDI